MWSREWDGHGGNDREECVFCKGMNYTLEGLKVKKRKKGRSVKSNNEKERMKG